jgi:hypothetical protein
MVLVLRHTALVLAGSALSIPEETQMSPVARTVQSGISLLLELMNNNLIIGNIVRAQSLSVHSAISSLFFFPLPLLSAQVRVQINRSWVVGYSRRLERRPRCDSLRSCTEPCLGCQLTRRSFDTRRDEWWR